MTFDGLGEHLFADDRAAAAGSHPLDTAHAVGARVLLVGANFGCGSSREHAPQAIRRAGFEAVIGVSFADIFAGNSLGIGLPCVTCERADLERLVAAAAAGTEVTLDLEARTVTAGTLTVRCALPEANRSALIEGRWDPLAELLRHADAAAQVRARLPY